MKRLGVLGTLVLDTIHDPADAEPLRAPGGVAYALSAFEAGGPAGWSVVPLLKVGEDARGEAEALLDALDSVTSREGVLYVPEPNNRVELRYREDGRRTERLEGGVPGWTWEELAPLARACDALYVNLIAGWELDLSGARRLRDAVPGPVYGDLHSLLLDRGEGGERRPRAPDGWPAWVGCFDFLQLNEDELTILADDGGEDPWSLAETLVGDAPRALFVTLGPEGAAWLAVPEGGAPAARDRAPHDPAGRASGEVGGSGRRLDRGRLAPPAIPGRSDPTGCGDVWGITCFGALLAGKGPDEAVAAANRMAARNASLRGGTALLGAEGG